MATELGAAGVPRESDKMSPRNIWSRSMDEHELGSLVAQAVKNSSNESFTSRWTTLAFARRRLARPARKPPRVSSSAAVLQSKLPAVHHLLRVVAATCPNSNTARSLSLSLALSVRDLSTSIPKGDWGPPSSRGVAGVILRSAGRGRLLVRLVLLGGGLGPLGPGGLLVARALAKRGGVVVLALAIEVEVSIILYT